MSGGRGMVVPGLIAVGALGCLVFFTLGSRKAGSSSHPKAPLPNMYHETPADTLPRFLVPKMYVELAAKYRTKRPVGGAESGLIGPVCTAVDTIAPRVEWRPVKGARMYEIEVLKGSSSTVFQRFTCVAPPANLANLEWGKLYSWSVRAKRADGSIIQVFTASEKLPGTFEVLPTAVADQYHARQASIGSMDRVGAAELAIEFGMLDEADRILSLAGAGKVSGDARPYVEHALERVRNRE